MIKKDLTIEDIKNNGWLIYETLRGSQVYNTHTQYSDKDYFGIFILPLEYLLANKYIPQVEDKKGDTVYYEIGRYLELLKKSNPSILESLFISEEHVLYKNPLMDIILEHKDKFITKECKKSVLGYSVAQIKAATRQNSYIRWAENKTQRKGVLDFIYTQYKQGSQLFTEWLSERGMKQEYCGLVKVEHMRYCYNVFYDYRQHFIFEDLSEQEFYRLFKFHINGILENYKYKGIVKDGEKSNDISLSSIPKGEKPIALVQFNKDAYTIHCGEYAGYVKWLEERNPSRYIHNEEHGQGIDSKNMYHMIRLLWMGNEIAAGKGMIVKRSEEEREYLLNIRKGKISLKTLLDKSEDLIKEADRLFDESNLPESIEDQLIEDLTLTIRKKWYCL